MRNQFEPTPEGANIIRAIMALGTIGILFWVAIWFWLA